MSVAAISILAGIAEAILPVVKDAVSSEPANMADPDGLARQKADEIAATVAGQMDVLLADARSGNFFQAGWRPACGWIGAFGLAWEFLARPVLGYAAALAGLPPLPVLPAEALWPLIGGLLGIAGLRSFDKRGGVADTAAVILGGALKGAVRGARK